MRFYLKKIGFYLVALFAALTLNFAIPRLMPGDPVSAVLTRLASRGGTVAPETREAITAMLGQGGGNIFQQYIDYLKNIFTGNWGVSVTYFPNQVTTSIASALPWTICLVGTTTIISFFIQQALGIWAGWRRGGAFDNIISPVSTIFQAVPYFWLALIFIWVFARTLHWFPQSGGYNYREVVPGFTWEFF